MPEKEMQQLSVYVSDGGNICVAQKNGLEEDSVIAFHPDQAEILIRWIQEAAEEIKKS